MYEHQGIENILFVALYVAVAMLAVNCPAFARLMWPTSGYYMNLILS